MRKLPPDLMNPAAPRRAFVRTFAFFAAAAACSSNFRWAATVLADVQPGALPDQGLLRLKLSDFPTLQKVNGSVRVGTSPIGPDNRPVGLFYPVIINRAAPNQFWALDASCSHEGCTVPVLDPDLHVMECPCHGSRYSISGEVLRGPANFSLRQFTTHFDAADGLTVELPDISFALEVIQLLNSPKRLQLQFIAFDHLQYEVHYRPAATAPWSDAIPFSLTADGAADQTVVTGQANYAQVYVDRTSPAGFYGISLRSTAV